MGTTPLELSYKLHPKIFESLSFTTTPLVIVKDGYIAKEKQVVLQIAPQWKYKTGEVASKVYDLTILEHPG